MANGVHVVQGFGVVRNFTKFTGEDLIDATQHHVENDFVDFPFTREPTVEGYVTGMTKGNLIFRKFYLKTSEII
jgi:hypothetical protein